jgi:TonB family protein
MKMKKILLTSLSILIFLSVIIPASVLSQDISNLTRTNAKSKKTVIKDKPDIYSYIDVDEDPLPQKIVRPVYPELALKSGVVGSVFVKVLIDETGKPNDAVVIKSAANILNSSVIQAAMNSSFSPAVKEGEKISCWTTVRYSFRMISDLR